MSKRDFKLFFFICVFFFFSSFSFAADTPSNLFAIGNYKYEDFDHVSPWIATSSDRGETFSYFSDKADKFQKWGGFGGASCNDSACVSVGSYDFDWPSPTDEYPMVAVSKNQGKTWAYSHLETSGLHKGTSPYKVSCNNQFCAMIGSHSDDGGQTHKPIVAVSKDNGSTWVYQIIKNTPWDYDSKTAFLDKIDCSSGNCIAIGAYQNEKKPFLVVSSKQGAEWSFKKIPFLIDPVRTRLRNIKCNNSFCAAVGDYTFGLNNHPLLLKSYDLGNTWSIVKFPDDVLGGMNNIICRDNECLATGGFWEGKKNVTYLAVSHDSGVSWTYPELQSPSGEKLNATIFLVAFSGNNYLAAGYEKKYMGDTPILFISHDKGKIWSYAKSIVPSDFDNNGYLNTLSCKNTFCLATGTYWRTDSNGNPSSSPYLEISNNGGEDWVFPSTVIANFPKDFIGWGNFSDHQVL